MRPGGEVKDPTPKPEKDYTQGKNFGVEAAKEEDGRRNQGTHLSFLKGSSLKKTRGGRLGFKDRNGATDDIRPNYRKVEMD